MQLSIIVPVYNTECYLVRCIESLLKIQVIDYEILLVDDGSTDNSGFICDEYAAKYNNIRSFHKKNGGSTSARMLGVANSYGKYIAFVDSDDWVGADIYTEFIYAMEYDIGLDACIGGLMKIFPDGTRCPVCPTSQANVMTNIETMIEMLKWQKFRWELCGNIYRRRLFFDFNPPEDIKIGEDLISNFCLLSNANKIIYRPIYQYYYFTNSESITESYKSKLRSLMKPFYNISNIDVRDKKLVQLIGFYYVKEIIKDIWYQILYDEFRKNCLFYRSELKKLLSVKNNYCFITQHFDIAEFQNSLESDGLFYDYWRKLYDNIVTKLHEYSFEYKKIYLYGAGVINKFFLNVLNKNGIKYDLCVISDGNGKKNEEVKYLSEIKDENNDIVFILTLASVYHDAVISNLQKRGYTNYLKIDIITDMYR